MKEMHFSSETQEQLLQQDRRTALMAAKRSNQNFIMAVFAGFVSALMAAAVWAVISVVTEYQIGWMAVGVGFIVGVAVRAFGRGMTWLFGCVGAVFALLGCVGGNFLTMVGFVAVGEKIGLLETFLLLDYEAIPGVMVDAFSPIDILFYALAVSGGYKCSLEQISDAELVQIS